MWLTTIYLYLMLLIMCINNMTLGKLRKINSFPRQVHLLQREPPLKYNFNKSKHSDWVEELWLEQKLDNFDVTNENIWNMRYLCNRQHYRKGGPMFIFLGGEWEISQSFLLSGHFYDMAKQHNAIMFYTEHRFYGHSWPTSNSTLDSLKYLSAQQSLADLTHFIEQQKNLIPSLKRSRIALTGASYAGSLASWFMHIYPDQAHVAWASSAPLWAKMDFHEYMQHVGASIRLMAGNSCAQRLQLGLSQLQHMLHANFTAIKERLQLCDSFNSQNANDVAAFFNSIYNYFALIVQSYSDKITQMCKSLMSLHSTDDLEAILRYLSYIFPTEQSDLTNNWCLDLSFSSAISAFNNAVEHGGSREWLHQTCNEFGWFATTSRNSSGKKHIFAHQVPLSYFQNLCQAVFGDIFDAKRLKLNEQRTNAIFTSNSSDKVFYTHGELDPWLQVGAQQGTNTLIIPDISHTSDLSSIDLNDSLELNVAKLKVSAFFAKFLNKK